MSFRVDVESRLIYSKTPNIRNVAVKKRKTNSTFSEIFEQGGSHLEIQTSDGCCGWTLSKNLTIEHPKMFFFRVDAENELNQAYTACLKNMAAENLK